MEDLRRLELEVLHILASHRIMEGLMAIEYASCLIVDFAAYE